MQKNASNVVVPLIIPQSVLTRKIDFSPIASIVALYKGQIDEICQTVLFLLQQNGNFSIPPVFCGIMIAEIPMDPFVVRFRNSGTIFVAWKAGSSSAVLGDGSVLGASRSLGPRQ